MIRRNATITVTALAAGAEETYTITESNLTPRLKSRPVDAQGRVPDIILVNPPTTAEDTWIITKAWVNSLGVVKFTASNVHATDPLTGGSLIVSYCVIR